MVTRGRMTTKAVKERVRWFQTFLSLYDKAEPLIQHITDLERLRAGELPVSPGILVESNITLRPVLAAIRKMTKPENKELATIQREFEMALFNCIKASEWAEKYINSRSHHMNGQAPLNMVINTTVLAREYMGSVSRRLAQYLE
jgi:hypothetical protein